MKSLKYAIFLFLAAIAFETKAQEALIGLQENGAVKKAAEKQNLSIQSAIMHELPFIDDFSKNTGIFPDQKKWEGTSVYINDSYGINAPSIGVATLDAINGKGELHQIGNLVSEPADTLLSMPININLPNDSIYLSFYFQAGGHGDMPESRDSLILQFSSDGNTWKTVWSAYPVITESTMVETYYRKSGKTIYKRKSDSLNEHFFKAHIKIDRPEFLTNNFRFRFINYASIAINKFVPGRASNADHWNLDFIYLDKNKSAQDTTIKDVAIMTAQKPLSDFYEQIPWLHYNAEARNKMFGAQMKINIKYTNLGWGTRNVTRHFEINPIFGNGERLEMSGGAENIDNFEIFDHYYDLPQYNFYSDTDSAKFEIKSYIITDNEPERKEYRYNDTTKYYQKFYNCYAYDDGTAENGYGIFGIGTSSGKVAVKFYCFTSDSLQGVYMYFNRTVNDANKENKFKLMVWDDDNGIPGKILYSQGATKPTYSDSLNLFVAYKFEKPIYIGRKTSFFVGWQQTNDDFINIGYDKNRNHGDKVFFNVNNAWQQSVYQGSLMLRPIFSTTKNFPENPILPPPVTNNQPNGVILSPNPATNVVRMVWKKENENLEPKKIEIFTTQGRLIKMENSDNNTIDVSDLQAGTYIIRIWGKNKIKETQKIIVAR